jgi:hypothetical protein
MEREPCGGDYYVEFTEGLEREITGEPIIFYLLCSLFYRFVLFKGKGDCSWTRKKDNFFQSYDIIQVIDGEPSQSSRFSHSVWQELRLLLELAFPHQQSAGGRAIRQLQVASAPATAPPHQSIHKKKGKAKPAPKGKSSALPFFFK